MPRRKAWQCSPEWIPSRESSSPALQVQLAETRAMLFPLHSEGIEKFASAFTNSRLTSGRRAFHSEANIKVPSPRTLNLLLNYCSCYNAVKEKASTKLLNMLQLFLAISSPMKIFSTSPYGDLVVKRAQRLLTQQKFSKWN